MIKHDKTFQIAATGLIAHRIGHITRTADRGHILRYALLSGGAGLLFNAIFDPLLGYFYKLLILGKPAAEVVLAYNIVSSSINAVTSLIVTTVLYMALMPAMKKSGLYPTLS